MAVDDDGCFTDRIADFRGRYVKEADKDIILAVKVRIFKYIRYYMTRELNPLTIKITVKASAICESMENHF